MERLKQVRERMGWSQRRLADEVGCSQQAILDYEKGRRRPAGDILVRLAVALGVSGSWLLGESDDPTRNDRLPRGWVQAVEGWIAIGLTPSDVQQAVRAWRVARGAESEGQHPVE